MAYGIDSTIQDKVNAFRGQPQQLMQQYGQSQQLVDLLALQQIKSEKEAAARQIQMAMAQKQGQPTTIAQQREQEVMGLTRNEIAKQVQQGMPQQPQAPQQAPQQGGGISALPAPNMQGMAGGGIVAFAGTERSDVPNPDDKKPRDEGVQDPYEIVATDENGDPITRADYERMRAGFNSLNNAGSNITYGKATPIAEANGFENFDIELPKTTPMAVSSGNPVRDMRLRNMEERQKAEGIATLQAKAYRDKQQQDAARLVAQGAEDEAKGDLGSQGSAIPTTAVTPPATTPPSGDYLSNMGATKAPPETGTDADTGEQTTTPAYSGPMGKGISSLARPTVATVDREGIRKGIASEYDNMPGLAELNKQRTDVANQLAQVYAKQNDPERQRQEKIHAFLSGLSHGATAASGLGLASEGVAETGKAQEAAKVTQIKELQANVEVRAKELMEMGFKRSDAMAKAVDEAQKNAISLYGHDITMYGDELKDREARARLLQEKYTDMTRYADQQVAKARAMGDHATPTAVLRANAMEQFKTFNPLINQQTQTNAQNDKMVQFIAAEVDKRQKQDLSTLSMTPPELAKWRDRQERELRASIGLPSIPQAGAGAADGWGNMSVK